MGNDVRIGLIAAAGVVALITGFIALIRYAVPAVLALHFGGALVAAWVVAITGVLALIWLGWRLWRWVAASLRGA